MESEFQYIWAEAEAKSLHAFHHKDLEEIRRINCHEGLLQRTRDLRQRYQKNGINERLNRLNPFLAKLKSFSDVVHIYIQANPHILALVWGSVSFILELAARHSWTLDRITTVFESFDHALPRFHYYVNKFGASGFSARLKEALVSFYTELIGTCLETIKFVKRSPLNNLLLGSIFRSIDSRLDSRVRHVQGLTSWVDQEASLVAYETQAVRHAAEHREILNQLAVVKKPMHVSNIPFNNLPFIQNASFYGREDVIARLTASLQSPQRQRKPNAQALYGLGGAGKTQVALEYAWRYVNHYDAIFWVNAETPLKLAETFGSLADQMGVGEGSRQLDKLRNLFKAWLSVACNPRGAIKWLLIFDNVENLDILKPYWPSGSEGSAIFTSRDREAVWGLTEPSTRTRILPFSVVEGPKFLLTLAQENDVQELSERELAAADKISAGVGHLPLALELIGRYIASRGITPGAFLTAHPNFERKFLFDSLPSLAQEHQQSINMTWTLKLPTLGDGARTLMNMLSFLDADGVIPSFFEAKEREDLVYGGPDDDGDGEEDEEDEHAPELDHLLNPPFETIEELDESMATLLRSSLITKDRDSGCLVCHRLVQLAVLHSMEYNQKHVIFHRLVFMLNAAFPTQSDGKPLHDKWTTCEQLFRQVSAILDAYKWIPNLDFPLLLGRIVVRCAWFMLEKGRYKAANEMITQVLSKTLAAIDSGVHPGYSYLHAMYTSSFLFSVQGSIAYEMNMPGHGYDIFVKTKSVRQQLADERITDDTRWLGYADGNIAVALTAEGRAEEALPLYLDLIEREDVKPNRDVYLSNLCICFYLLGRYEDALEYAARALELVKEVRGVDSVQVAAVHFYQANIYRRQNRLDDAFDAVRECMRIRSTMMPHHHYTGLTVYKLGEIARDRGDLQASIAFFRKSMNILDCTEYHFGAYCRTAFALAGVLSQTGQFGDAAKMMEVGKEAQAKIQGIDATTLSTRPEDYDRFVGFAHC